MDVRWVGPKDFCWAEMLVVVMVFGKVVMLDERALMSVVSKVLKKKKDELVNIRKIIDREIGLWLEIEEGILSKG